MADHEDRITPHVNCKKCGSQDTRLIKPPPHKLQPGERVLVEAEIVSDETDCWKINLKTYRQPKYGIDIFVPLSSIRPMPEREGGE